MRQNVGVSTPAEPTSDRTTVQVRRAPKLSAFMTVGALMGFLVVLIITPLFPVDPLVGLPALIGYFSIFGITAGVLIGAIIGIVLDRRSQKHVRTVQAERQTVEASPDVDAS
ncbi:MAG: hypothetical protein C0444_10075 [Microbacterium sp.]|nr:hypothetical protein [Microbacterium sp.]MBA4344923.1 hypothetical protein [Microbacterium sp.]